MRLDLQPDQNTRDAQEAKNDAVVIALANAGPQQIDAWLDANVNNLADAKRVLKTLTKIVVLQLQGKL